MLENMTYEELARETMRSDCKLAKAVLEKCDETLQRTSLNRSRNPLHLCRGGRQGIFTMIQTFNFDEVRTAIKDNGDVYFCLAEISNANPSRFSLDEEGVHKMYTPTNGGIQHLTFVNEPLDYLETFSEIDHE